MRHCLSAVFCGLLTCRTVLAHPGHGEIPSDSALHYVAEPAHAGWLLVALVVGLGLAIWRFQVRRLARIPARERSPQSREG